MASNDSSLPIDIHCSKLLEWLQSRRHCSKDWQKSALVIRSKIADAMQDMPEHSEIVELLGGVYINFFHCRRICEILKQADAASKNIFGHYSSQRVNDWLEIINLYQKDNLFLAESGQMLQQYTQYEIPALKKQITKCHTMIQECEKKETDYEKQARECRKFYKTRCEKMGLKGENLRQELLVLCQDLPQMFEKIVNNILLLAPAVDYYKKFRSLVVHEQKESNETFLISLLYLIKNGNVTVFEWKRGMEPEKVERMGFDDLQLETNEPVLDDVIDFGDEVVDCNQDNKDQSNIIDFGIEEIAQGQQEQSFCETTTKDSSDMIARLDEAFTLLENDKFLKLLNCDLHELKAFFFVRNSELQRPYEVQFATLDANFSEAPEEVQAYLTKIETVIRELNDERTRQFLNLRLSPFHREKLISDLQESLKRAEKCEAQRHATISKANELEIQAKNLGTQVDNLTKRAKELQKQIEDEISKKYENRPVHVIGSTVVVK